MIRYYLSLLIFLAMIASSTSAATASNSVPKNAPKIDRIDPPYWWTGMHQDSLQLMVFGPDIANAQVALQPYEGVRLAESVRLESHNYLLLYLVVGKDTQPGTLQFSFTNPAKRKDNTLVMPYELKARDRAPEAYPGFDAADVLYLVMPDRFAQARTPEEQAEALKGLKYPVGNDRQNPNGRHGGDLKGLQAHLDYIDTLGVTAVWVNPVLTNDVEGGAYHGYATTDYYRIDPRLGTNQEWRDLIEDAHQRGLKVVMDMIFNHSGDNHPWFVDRPSHDWFNFPDQYVQTNYRLSTVHDPYVSDYDLKRTVDGWFVESMPDLNQRNPHLMKYLIQNSIWWIEDSKIDGIRMDTHPYANFEAMAGWIDAVLEEYPNFNIVGECWYSNEGGEAFWQRGSKVNPKGDPRLPTVMDFVLSTKARDAFSSQTDRLGGLNVIYDHLALDYLFPDPSHILTFLDNHDTDRFLLEVPDDLGWWKQAQTFLLTSRGIPQIYYGTELLMHGSKEGSDGYIRLDMPGGFPGDETSVFTAEGRTPEQQEAFDFLSKLLNWRRGNEVISRGTLKHFMPENGMYVYQRRLGDKAVTILMNGTDEPLTTTMERTVEILPYGTTLHDMLTDSNVTIKEEMTFPARAILILE